MQRLLLLAQTVWYPHLLPGKFLRGDGTWQPLVSYGEATATNAGLMSAADKTKLDGLVLATSAEVKAMLDEVFAEA